MSLAMLGFAIDDTFIKLLAASLPTWQILALLGAGGAAVFAVLVRARGQVLLPAAILSPAVLMRNLGELFGSICMVTALALTPLSQVSAILQATPLAVTLGAALFLGERVGWRRWSAIAAGFFGVMLVIRPGSEAFDTQSLFSVGVVVGLALRDLSTRWVAAQTSSLQLGFLGFLTLVPAAVILRVFLDQPAVMPGPVQMALLPCVVLIGVAGYYAIIAATRVGDISFVAPFRYSRIVFALILGYAVFDERPDALMLAGSAAIVASGLYTVWRERAVGRKPG